MKKYLAALLLALPLAGVSAQEETYKAEVSGGVGVLSAGSGKASASYSFASAGLSYYYSRSFGFYGGLTYAGAFEGLDALYELPFYLTHRSGVSTRKSKERAGGQSYSAKNALWSFVSYSLPSRLDWSVGATLGYYHGEPKAFSQGEASGFEVNSRIGLSADAELRFYYVFGRFKLSVAPAVGYLLTSNLVYAGAGSDLRSSGESYSGMSPHIRFRVMGGVALSLY